MLDILCRFLLYYVTLTYLACTFHRSEVWCRRLYTENEIYLIIYTERTVNIMNLDNIVKNGILLFDGAMGTMLQKAGLGAGELPEVFNMVYPHIIAGIHREYLEAGAEVITTNTFGANEYKLQRSGHSVEEVITRAVEIAREAAGEKLVALDMGPTGKLMEPAGDLSFDEAYRVYARQVKAGAEAGADLILIETISDIYEAKAAVLAARENSSLPVFCTMTFQQNGRTLTGTDPITMVNVLESLGADAIGVNCSLGPREILPIVKEILKYSRVPVMVQPNAGLPRLCGEETVYDITEGEFASYIKDMAQMGAVIFGGCCGTNPSYIKASKEMLKGLKSFKTPGRKRTMISSSSRTVVLGEGVKVVGETINPSGRKGMKDALIKGDMDFILTEAISQKEAGADMLNINVGLPQIDEKEMMMNVIREIQGIVNIPFQIDSTTPEVIEAAVRVYNGRPVINSVNGKEESMRNIFPIVRKYGTCVIGLTLDDRGMPKTAEERVEIAGRIIDTAASYGIPKEDIIIDCLVLTVSTQQAEVMETLKAVSMVKKKYGVNTLLGISNISYGLPHREVLNRNYLAMALTHGLDAPIVNPAAEGIMDTVKSFKVLANQDREAKDYIEKYGTKNLNTGVKEVRNNKDLKQIIMDGVKEEASQVTGRLLETISPMEIVDSFLIPALDIVGQKYENGDIFLPQLIQSAEAVRCAFEVIKENILKTGGSRISKGRILLATVKGDVHDIGKNIVKILLENYGFEVIDLGKDVQIEMIVETVRNENIELVGLSALMTTTVRSMEDTIKSLKENNLNCKVMVGGAVLNKEYAEKIGADFYAKDASEGVRIAREVFKV